MKSDVELPLRIFVLYIVEFTVYIFFEEILMFSNHMGFKFLKDLIFPIFFDIKSIMGIIFYLTDFKFFLLYLKQKLSECVKLFSFQTEFI